MTTERSSADSPLDQTIDDLIAPFEAPRSGAEPFEAPRSGAEPFEAPRSGAEPFEAPGSGGEAFERPQGERSPFEAPQGGVEPFELPAPIPDAEPVFTEADEATAGDPVAPAEAAPSLSFDGLPEAPRLRAKPVTEPKRPWWRFW